MATIDAKAKLLVPEREYVFDNPPIHKSADLNKLGIGEHRRQLHPSQSPDFNKPAENAHAILAAEFRERLVQLDVPRSPEFYMHLLLQCFVDVITTEVIRKCVLKLPLMYECVGKSVEEGGVAGGWPPPPLR